MTVEFTEEVSSRLSSDHYGWLTTVAKSGQPVPRLVWFYFDGTDLMVYSMPNAAKVRHVKARPRVTLNLESDGNGSGVIVVGGEARIDAENFDPREDSAFWAKYKGDAERSGFTESYAAYNTRRKISVERVWTTADEG
jgi:PPOX class probable F420-dependent enzyme